MSIAHFASFKSSSSQFGICTLFPSSCASRIVRSGMRMIHSEEIFSNSSRRRLIEREERVFGE